MRKHIHPATPCILHNHVLEFLWIYVLMLFYPLHIAFLSICTLVRKYMTLAAGLQRPFQCGSPSLCAAAPCTNSTAPSLSCRCFLHSICQVYMCVCIFAAKILPSVDHPHSLIMVTVCCSGVINGQCVSPEDCWIHTQGETSLACHNIQRRILWGYCKRIIVLSFVSQLKPSSSLTLQRSGRTDGLGKRPGTMLKNASGDVGEKGLPP